MSKRHALRDANRWLTSPSSSLSAAATKRVTAFVLDADRLTRTDLTTARDDEYGAGWNAALATLRRRLGLES